MTRKSHFRSAYIALFVLILATSAMVQADQRKVEFVFQSMSPNYFKLYLVNGDGTQEELTTDMFAILPSFSPDGKILYFEGKVPIETYKTYFYQIFKLDRGNYNAISQISDNSAMDSHPVCSPDGKRIAFCSRTIKKETEEGLAKRPQRSDEEPMVQFIPWKIYTMDVDGKNRRRLDPLSDDAANELYPSWSPDGSKIVYVVKTFVDLMKGELHIPTTILKVRDLEKETTTSLVSICASADEPSWSPKGDQIAFSALSMDTMQRSIWLANADGTNMRKITEGPYDGRPTWFPDGKKIMFTRRETAGKKAAVWALELSTGRLAKVFDSPEPDVSIDFVAIHVSQ